MPTDKRLRQRENAAARAAALRQQSERNARRRRVYVLGIPGLVILALIVFLVIQSSSGGRKKTSVTTTASTVPSSTPSSTPASTPATTPGVAPTCPPTGGSATRVTRFNAAPGMCIDPTKTYTATMVTDLGTMTIALDAKAAPKTVNNFVFLARYHFYDGLTFHRVIPGFVDQGGDPNGDGSGDPGYKFADELPAAGAYKVGSLAMANGGPDTNGSQFFIIVGAQGVALPAQYSLFGQVTAGIDVAHAIEKDGSQAGTPTVVHKITTVTIAES